jgi:hypothetical protein
MTTVAASEFAWTSGPRAMDRAVGTISGCCRAILAHFAVDPESCHPGVEPAQGGELGVGEISRVAGHLSMTLFLRMPYGAEHMSVSTIGPPRLVLPGLSLSPRIASAAVGQPIGRLTGHRAFRELDHLLVSGVEADHDGQGRRATILHFEDPAEPLLSVRRGAASGSVH